MKHLLLLLIFFPALAFGQNFFNTTHDCGELKTKTELSDWACIDSSGVECEHIWVYSKVKPVMHDVVAVDLVYDPCRVYSGVTGIQYRICALCGEHEKQTTTVKTWYEAPPKSEYEKVVEKFNPPQPSRPVPSIRFDGVFISAGDSIKIDLDTTVIYTN